MVNLLKDLTSGKTVSPKEWIWGQLFIGFVAFSACADLVLLYSLLAPRRMGQITVDQLCIVSMSVSNLFFSLFHIVLFVFALIHFPTCVLSDRLLCFLDASLIIVSNGMAIISIMLLVMNRWAIIIKRYYISRINAVILITAAYSAIIIICIVYYFSVADIGVALMPSNIYW